MYLSDLIRNDIDAKIKATCIGKTVTISDENYNDITFKCKDVSFHDDDGNAWLVFIDDGDNEHLTDGQGIDIWFDILD